MEKAQKEMAIADIAEKETDADYWESVTELQTQSDSVTSLTL